MAHTDPFIIDKIDRCLDDDRDPLDSRVRRCITLENRGKPFMRKSYIAARASGVHV